MKYEVVSKAEQEQGREQEWIEFPPKKKPVSVSLHCVPRYSGSVSYLLLLIFHNIAVVIT